MKENLSIKANINNHPSYQSKFKPHKPSIKVDYKIIHSNQDNLDSKIYHNKKIFNNKINQQTSFLSSSNYNQQNISSNYNVSRVKSVQGFLKQYQSGKFIQSQYCPNQPSKINQSRHTSHKGRVSNANNKYQHSKSVQNIMKQQYHKKRTPSCFVAKSRINKQKTQYNSIQTQNSKTNSSKLTVLTGRSGLSQRSKLPSYSQQGIKDIIEYEYAGKYRQQRVTPKCIAGTNERIIKDRFRAFDQIHDFDFRKRVNTLSNQVRLTKGLR